MNDWPTVVILSSPLLKTGRSPHWISAESMSVWASQVTQWQRFYLPMQETRILSLGQEECLVEGMANCSSILAWISWTEEPGGVYGVPRVRHDWATEHHHHYVYVLRDLPQPLFQLEESDRHISQLTIWKIKSSYPWHFILASLLTALLFGGKCQQLEQSLWTRQESCMWKIKRTNPPLGTGPNRLLWEKCKLHSNFSHLTGEDRSFN